MPRTLLFAMLILIVMAPVRWGTAHFSFNGTFTSDTDIQFFTFTLNADTPGVTILTWSAGGGTNAAGTVIPAGGFVPDLSFFMSDGTEMNPAVSPGNCGPS